MRWITLGEFPSKANPTWAKALFSGSDEYTLSATAAEGLAAMPPARTAAFTRGPSRSVRFMEADG